MRGGKRREAAEIIFAVSPAFEYLEKHCKHNGVVVHHLHILQVPVLVIGSQK